MPRPSSEGTSPEITPFKVHRARKHAEPTGGAVLHTVVRAASGELRCPICQQAALADANGLMLWHEATRGDGELVDCPGISVPGNELLNGEAA